MESEITKFIESHVAKIKPILKKANISYFNAITTGKKEFYGEFENFRNVEFKKK